MKSSTGAAFLLSSGEWRRAEGLAERGHGDRYGVLVVHRSRKGGVPEQMDLLLDPVKLVKAGQLRQEADTYRLSYRPVPAQHGQEQGSFTTSAE